VVAAATWMIANPERGSACGRSAARLHPRDLPAYLGELISTPSDWTPLLHYVNFFEGFNSPLIDWDDPWQFKNSSLRTLIEWSPKHATAIGAEHGTPLFVVDHEELRRNFATFRRYLPRVQAYYAVKANPDRPSCGRSTAPGQLRRGSIAEFLIVHENIKDLPPKERRTSSGTRSSTPTHQDQRDIGRVGPLQAAGHLRQFRGDQEGPEVCSHAAALRIQVPNTGAMVELSSKFGAPSGQAVSLIEAAHEAGFGGRGTELPRRQPDNELRELRAGLNLAAGIFKEAKERGFP